MLIRRATQPDREAIYRVHVTSVRVTCVTHYAPHELDGWVGTKHNEFYAVPIDTCDVFVAVEHDHVVGFSQLNPTMYEVEAVYVDPTYLRRGIGASLLKEAEVSAWSRGLRDLRLAASLNAVPFYESCGYLAHAEAMYRLNSGISVRCVPMTKRLRKPEP